MTRGRLALRVLVTFAVAAATSSVSSVVGAQDANCKKNSRGVCSESGTDDFGVGIGEETSEKAPARPISIGGRPKPTTYIEKQYVPTCTGNSAQDSGVVCTAAFETCPVEGQVRFWVFAREVTITTGEATQWQRVSDPSSICLGPDDPAIDPQVAIPAIVQRDFKRVVVLKGVAEVSPKPDTLVNIPTVFTTSAPASYDIPLTLLGQAVVITANAERYTWHFGDGESGTTTRPGGRVEHEYTEAAAREAYVVIEWSGSFRVNGGAAQPINGTATTTGEPVAVEVKQARTELVRD